MITAILLIGLSFFLFKKWENKFPLSSHFYFFFASKLAAGIVLGLVYTFYYKGGDTFTLFNYSSKAAELSFSELLDFVFEGAYFPEVGAYLWEQPRALFFVRLITLPTWLCFGNYWAVSTVLSLVSFWAVWLLGNRLYKEFQLREKTVLYALFYFPEVLFWSSGVMKETVSFALQCFILLSFLFLINKKRLFLNSLFFVVLSYLLFSVKFYVAATFVPALLAYVLAFQLKKWRRLSYVGIYFSILLVASFLHPSLDIRTAVNEVYLNMTRTVAISEPGKFIVFNQFDGSFFGMVLDVPKALLSGLFRPFVWEGQNGFMSVIGIFRLDFLIGTLFFLYLYRRVTLEGVALIVYSLVSISLLTLASPNFGTLSRYIIAATPFLAIVGLEVILPVVDKWMGEKQQEQ